MRIGTSVVVTNNGHNTVLLIHNIRTGHWELPGGKLDPDESVIQAAARELKEETGLQVEHLDDLEFVGYYEHHSRPTYEDERWLNMVFTIDYALLKNRALRVTEPEKHDQIRWFEVTRLPSKTWNVCVNCIIQLLEKRRRER
jgi:8-oxo-dGTP diphosphatase